MGNADARPQSAAPQAENKVTLCATKVGPEILKLMMPSAYHTSIGIDGMDFYFSPTGLCWGTGLHSHQKFDHSKYPTQVVDIGCAAVPRKAVIQTLLPYFQKGTYDLLRKNCNAFTDCALYLMFGRRLDVKYKAFEQVARRHDTSTLTALSFGDYVPNPQADNFSVDAVLEDIDRRKDVCGIESTLGFRACIPQETRQPAQPWNTSLVPGNLNHAGPMTKVEPVRRDRSPIRLTSAAAPPAVLLQPSARPQPQFVVGGMQSPPTAPLWQPPPAQQPPTRSAVLARSQSPVRRIW